MEDTYIQDKEFKTIQKLDKGEYENCLFIQCDFANFSFKEFKFIDCRFQDCNLSLVNFNLCFLQNVEFINTKMIGSDFSNAKDFGLSIRFENCLLNQSNFYKKDLQKTLFKNCQIQEADFSETNLSEAKFIESDLQNSIFDQTNLEKTDLETAYNLSINPTINKLKKTIFSQENSAGLLHHLDIIIK